MKQPIHGASHGAVFAHIRKEIQASSSELFHATKQRVANILAQYLSLVYTFWENRVSPYLLIPCSLQR